MRATLIWVVILLLGCGSRRSTARQRGCSADSLLRTIANAISQGNLPALDGVLLTSSDIEQLNGRRPSQSQPSEFDRMLRSAAGEDIARLQKVIAGYVLRDVRLGSVRRGPVEGLAADAEVMRDSQLVFGSPDKERIVRIDQLFRVGSCWKLAQIGPSAEVPITRVSGTAVKNVRTCESVTDALSIVSRALTEGTDMTDIIVAPEDLQKITNNRIDVTAASRLAKSIRFDALNDIAAWRRQTDGATVVERFQVQTRVVPNWLGTGVGAKVLSGSILVRTKEQALLKVEIREVVQAGECAKLVWLGSP